MILIESLLDSKKLIVDQILAEIIIMTEASKEKSNHSERGRDEEM